MASVIPLETEYVEGFFYSSKDSMAKRKVYYPSYYQQKI